MMMMNILDGGTEITMWLGIPIYQHGGNPKKVQDRNYHNTIEFGKPN